MCISPNPNVAVQGNLCAASGGSCSKQAAVTGHLEIQVKDWGVPTVELTSWVSLLMLVLCLLWRKFYPTPVFLVTENS